ncbi:V-type ATP synthase subunit E [Treponema sp. OMZ 792]|uniref:V-type ATP synthase subunit E n=1 Tax=unclassified Treponema TaxID=2638727 RepID=UPI0020A27255|nr:MULTISPECIES: V-type ATP synthase subunit E [unclassified Treponema]UTC76336.1 V-type ATP synthase subunit E [Treponema sp. OMZ 792]UTC77785.1 V-type ATP synthase subunit E [Treponema sp. OMZ 799]UTC80336.1 V-type ATP synthase subunit E [Treponema sp. OMZ 798]
MEVQLQELVDKIKKDGVAAADEKAAEIIRAAEEKAKSIIEKAEAEAQESVKKAEAEALRFQKAAESSIDQASRNTLISFRQGLLNELNAIIKAETSKNYDSSVLKNLIPEAVKGWVKADNTEDLSVILSDKDLKELESSLGAALKEHIAKGLELKADSKTAGGFKIGTKDGAAYYDFSAEAVADLFSSYLSPKTAEILKNAAKEL